MLCSPAASPVATCSFSACSITINPSAALQTHHNGHPITASQAFSGSPGGRKASKKDSLPILKSKRHQKRFVSKPGGPLFKLARLAGFEPTACRLGANLVAGAVLPAYLFLPLCTCFPTKVAAEFRYPQHVTGPLLCRSPELYGRES